MKNNRELKKKLIELQESNSESLLSDIAENVSEEENITSYLLELYGDLGLKYSLNQEFLISHIDEITEIIKEHKELAKKYISIESYTVDASWFAYQIILQKLLQELLPPHYFHIACQAQMQGFPG